MLEKTYAGVNINCSEDGYFTNIDQWNEAIAVDIAAEEGISLTEKHWEVLRYLREQQKNEVGLTIRRIGKSGIVSIKEFYQLFPGGPLKKASRIAGIPKPVSCI